MIEGKDIKIHINEYHKLIEDIKTESIILSDEFMFELLIEKLPQSWMDYKQQLKHRHKQMSLSDMITHIIIKDTNRKECAAAKAKTLSTKANVVEDKLPPNSYKIQLCLLFTIYIVNWRSNYSEKYKCDNYLLRLRYLYNFRIVV